MSYPRIDEPITLWCIVNPSGHIRYGYEAYEEHAWDGFITGRIRYAADPETIAQYKAAGWRAVPLACTPVETAPRTSLVEAFANLREATSGAFDNVDADAYVREMRGRDPDTTNPTGGQP